MTTQQKKIWIFGDSPLVEEYAALCVGKGCETRVRINEEGSAETLPAQALPIDESESQVDLVLELTNLSTAIKQENLKHLDALLASHVPIVSSAVTITVAEQATWIAHTSRLIGIGALPSLTRGSLIEYARGSATDEATQSAAREFAEGSGKSAVFVADSPGMVLPRILCALANEACFAVMEGVADGGDIDTAMKLGTNYPRGPVEWARAITPQQVHAVMKAMHSYFGEERYRPAPLLQRAAMAKAFP